MQMGGGGRRKSNMGGMSLISQGGPGEGQRGSALGGAETEGSSDRNKRKFDGSCKNLLFGRREVIRTSLTPRWNHAGASQKGRRKRADKKSRKKTAWGS